MVVCDLNLVEDVSGVAYVVACAVVCEMDYEGGDDGVEGDDEDHNNTDNNTNSNSQNIHHLNHKDIYDTFLPVKVY